MAKERATGAHGRCTLWDDVEPRLCGENVKWLARGEEILDCNATPARIWLRNTTWTLDELEAFGAVARVDEVIDAVERAVTRFRLNILRFRPRHR